MHSLVVAKNDEYFTEDEVRSNCYIFNDGTIRADEDCLIFGRSPFQVLTKLRQKAFYVLASMCQYKGDDVYKEVCDVIRSYIPEFVDFELETFAQIHEKKYYTEDSIINIYGKNNYVSKDDFWIVWGYRTGYVDEDILSGFLVQENISITEFLKNKKYIVVVDGDEYCIYNTIKKSGIINTSFIEREYPNREDEL